MPLLGWDLLTKLNAKITSAPGGLILKCLWKKLVFYRQHCWLWPKKELLAELSKEIFQEMSLEGWAKGRPAEAKTATPIQI